jgi:dihydrolipoamide dehydrogenase
VTPPDRIVDIIVIGAGSAGMSAYKAARAYGASVLVAEGDRYGTTCARVGCMPSKLLIAAADAAHQVRHAARFGVLAADPVVDGHAVMERVRSERDRFVGFVLEDVASWPETDRIDGRARFLDPHHVQVGRRVVRAGRVIVATGSRPVWPAAWDALGDRLIINDDVFDWDTLPRSVAVVGAGVIGLELAQALARLGVAVKLYGRDGQLGPRTDPQVRIAAAEAFAGEYDADFASPPVSIARDGDAVVVTERVGGGTVARRFDYLLAATGRRANLDGLDLERAGVMLDTHLFLAGDAAPDIPLLHEASDAGRIAGENAARYPFVAARRRRTPLGIVFSDPQIAMAGLSRRQLEESGHAFVTGAVSFAGQGRARVAGRNTGLLHVYADPASGRFLGTEMVGPDAEHLAHLLAWSIESGRTVQQMLDSPFYHPVIEEGLRTALRHARDQLGDAARSAPCLDCRAAA